MAKVHGPKNARFWFWHNGGWVRLTLKAGDRLTAFAGGSDGEGWTHEVSHWHHTGRVVRYSWRSEGRDCDGRHSAGGESLCPLHRLAADERLEDLSREDGPMLKTPDWQAARDRSYHVDHAAEAAGY